MDHVVVVGAGIGGLVASLVLSRVAKQVTLVERADRPAEVGAALALQANGMAVLARLGLLPSVEKVGSRIDRAEIRNAGGRVLLTAKMPDFGGGLDHLVAVRRTELQEKRRTSGVGSQGLSGWCATVVRQLMCDTGPVRSTARRITPGRS